MIRVVKLSILSNMNLKNPTKFWVVISILVCGIVFVPIEPVMGQSNTSNSTTSITLARLQYRGGGDWYNDPSALVNLIKFSNERLPVHINTRFDDVAVGSRDLFRYPFVFMTGHGNVTMNATELQNLRRYLDRGGFLFIDDDYGMDKYVRPLINQLFPDEELIDLPFSHPVFNQAFAFPNGIPKIHEHDNHPPQLFGLFRNGKLVLLYGYESNISDGWADAEIHGVSETTRDQSLKMGANILMYVLTTSRVIN
jgi:hypothetical protein